MIKAVIFDMDGVIADTVMAHMVAQKKTLAEIEINVSIDFLLKSTGIPTRKTFEELIKKHGLEKDANELAKRKDELLMHDLKKTLKPIPGAIELIKRLHEKKFKLAVGSSSRRELIETILNALGLSNCFNAIVSYEDVSNGKPAPDIFLKAAENLEVNPEECIVIEDSMHGVSAAKNAGMKCIGFKSKENDHDLSKADLVVNDLKKITIEKIKELGEQ